MSDQQLRVVSLLPSATDLVSVSGGLHLLVGRSHECDWPKEVQSLPVLTGAINQFQNSKQMDDVVNSSLARGEGLYFLEQQRLQELKPDVIVTQDLCNVCSVDLKLVERTIADFPVKPKIVTLNPQKLSDVLSDLERVGSAIGLEQQSKEAIQALQSRVDHAQAVAQAATQGQPVKVAFIEWLEPLFMGGHWTPEMIRMAGGVHPLNLPIGGGGAGPSFRTSHEALVEADCDWNIVCPCGFSIADTLKEADLLTSKPWWQELRAVKAGRVVIVDGSQMFARPGPRLVDALEFLVGLLHNKPELIPQDFPWQYWPSCTPADSISPGSSPTELELPLGSATDNDLPSVSATAASGSDGLSSGIPNSRTSVSEAAGDQTQDGGEVKSTTDSLSTDHAKASRSVNGNSSGSARFRSIADGVTTTKASSASPQRVTAAVSEDTEKAQAEWLDDNAGGQTHGHEAAAVSSASLSNGAVSGVNEAQQPDTSAFHQRQAESSTACSMQHSQPQPPSRAWCAPDLGPDIEEAHANAIRNGKPTYTDPATGYTVLTEQTLRQQSVCCANRCRHCPFGHFKVPAARGPRINTITEPTLLRLNRKSSSPVGCKLIPWPVSALTHQHFSAGCTANNISIQQELAALRRLIDNAAIDELGTSNSSLSATALEKDAEEESSLSGPQNTVFLVAFDSTSMLIWGSKHQMLHDVLNWALRHKQALFVLPVNGHEVDYHLGVVNEHMAFAQAALSKQT